MVRETGTLWRIRRTGEPAGERPPEPLVLPLYPAQFLLAPIAGAIGLAAVVTWILRRRPRRNARSPIRRARRAR
jgi:hypothetical protein